MEIHLQVGRRHLVVPAVIAAAVLGGVAYAAIPDAGGAFTACRLDSNGSLRLIDPSLSSGPLSRCTANETQVQWNEQGQAGVSPTVVQLAAGDAHCSTGGASITDAAGAVAFVCNGAAGAPGQPGKDGAPFAGTFTSPNGQFTLTVADGGVTIVGPDSSISLPAAGGIRIQANDVTTEVAHDETTVVGHNRTVAVGNDQSTSIGHNRTDVVSNDESVEITGNRTETVHKGETIRVDRSRNAQIGLDDVLSVSGNRSEHVGAALQVQAAGAASIAGGLLSLGGAGGCNPAARVGDLVSPTAILTGSATVCIGG